MANYTTVNKSTDYFNTKLWTGTGSELAITGINYQPDMVWVKRKEIKDHNLYDAVRAATKIIYPNDSSGEDTDAQSLKSFDSDGFTLGTATNVNASGGTYVSWNWKANGAGSSNTDGSISATVSVDTTAKQSIVKWTGTGANATVGHGLGTAPALILMKNLVDSEHWVVYHESLGNTQIVQLNTTSGFKVNSKYFNDTSPTNSVFTVGDGGEVNGSGDGMIAYCFANNPGYFQTGEYYGNGNNDGPFIVTGFRPALVLIKNYADSSGASNNGGNWGMWDNKREGYNPENEVLYANLNNAQGTTNFLDFCGSGFKITNSDSDFNNNNNRYIYFAVGQTMSGTNNVPCNAF
tara:strand:+ start:2593 stop:3639 length:1047 start_codon:yes stop_codon:yes gene_type:complete